MRNDRLIPGTILVIIGILFLLNNFGAIEFNWWVFLNLWPILLIIGGVNLVFAHNRSQWATIVKIAVLLCGMAILIICGLTRREVGWPVWAYHINRDLNDDDDDTTGRHSVMKIDGNSVYREEYHPGITTATLNIAGGATTYRLNGVTTDLFEATTKEFNMHYNLNTHIDSTSATIDFDMDVHKHGIFNWGHKKHNEADIKLNATPEWEIELQSGASSANFDLSPFKVKRLEIQGGAASYTVKLGQPLAETTVDINSGMASVTLYIPKNAACSINVDTGLSSKTLDGFDKKDDGSYETPGFDKAANKIKISFDALMSDFKVIRY
ncbi:hypothetical protein BEL04_00945 [Mucilaginibacter sp. PPCGB 2223]|uniref:LiaI-LiaF-like domain-containing protein n=1 Tax=Mucilaginibacter sp. PPCGB 2223 TaxID=1886027 RepID=UPI0008579D62|nr:DUF5668 domain-containing protein [Mucilaginibacter sp. PPCGB 2223]OCX52926.1 hypothetical protein BEL04_00945 [Mucilaginibacter sp. PPCGB 2223]